MSGIAAGLAANFVKMAVEHTAYRLGFSKETGAKKAAGFFISPRKYHTLQGKLVGLSADFTIAAALGIVGSYLFTASGRDHYLLKGLAVGDLSWSAMYGVMSQFGATKVKANDPNTALTFMFSHTAFGLTKAFLLNKITNPGLYQPHFQSLGRPVRPIEEKDETAFRLH